MPVFIKTLVLTSLALICFAANSVLCRLALGEQNIDASSFTNIRLLSGSITLLFIMLITKSKQAVQSKGSWLQGIMLFVYAVSFSYAYLRLETGTGALILFGSVQLTMLCLSLFSGTHLHSTEFIGMFIAFGGFVYLILPGVSAPFLSGFILMSLAGIAWGVYTLKGCVSKNPLMDTSYNFSRTLPFAVILFFFGIGSVDLTPWGILLACLSGCLTSGIGYTIWYTALNYLTSIQAAVIQLLVPIIASLGGIIFVSETLTLRLSLSTIFVLGGILLVILGKAQFNKKHNTPYTFPQKSHRA